MNERNKWCLEFKNLTATTHIRMASEDIVENGLQGGVVDPDGSDLPSTVLGWEAATNNSIFTANSLDFTDLLLHLAVGHLVKPFDEITIVVEFGKGILDFTNQSGFLD
jgi:hypothetical protein